MQFLIRVTRQAAVGYEYDETFGKPWLYPTIIILNVLGNFDLEILTVTLKSIMTFLLQESVINPLIPLWPIHLQLLI